MLDIEMMSEHKAGVTPIFTELFVNENRSNSQSNKGDILSLPGAYNDEIGPAMQCQTISKHLPSASEYRKSTIATPPTRIEVPVSIDN